MQIYMHDVYIYLWLYLIRKNIYIPEKTIITIMDETMTSLTNMSYKKNGHLYDRIIIRIPINFFKDSKFPFTVGEKIKLEIIDNKIVIKKKRG